MASLFDLLGLDPSASDAAIRSAFRKRMAELHPDRNHGLREQATKVSAALSAQFAAYKADPAAYRAQHAAPAPPPEAAPGEGPPGVGVPEVDEALSFASSLVELFAPAERLPAARRVISTGATFARRYVSRR